MQIFIVIFSRMNLFTNHPIHPWGLLPSMPLCCPHPTYLLLSLSLNVNLLETLVTIRAISMEVGVPTSSAAEATDLQRPYQISAASTTLPPVTTYKVIGRAIGNAAGGRILAANCAKHSAIQILTALNSSTGAMDNNLVQIWRCVISP